MTGCQHANFFVNIFCEGTSPEHNWPLSSAAKKWCGRIASSSFETAAAGLQRDFFPSSLSSRLLPEQLV
jgi:hypothetical protein